MIPKFYPKGSFPPVSNTERQRQFRERNPGYYGRLHRKRKAVIDARLAEMKAQELAVEEAAQVKTPLALPAPAITFEFPGINAWPTKESIAQKEAVEVRSSQHY